jgi:ferric-chelate reductase (NADPH)
MSLIAKILSSVLEKIFLISARVTEVRTYGQFRWIELQGRGFRKRDWSPGDKLRVKVGDLELRTYTPFAWDKRSGVVRLLAYLPGRGPGSEWARTVRVGNTFRFKGPEKSLKLSKGDSRPVIFFGDETALGAAAALRAMRPDDRDLRFIFECEDPDAAREALSATGLADALLRPKAGTGAGSLAGIRDQILEWARTFPEKPMVFLVGNQASLKELKPALAKELDAVKTKVYWREGRTGLD